MNAIYQKIKIRLQNLSLRMAFIIFVILFVLFDMQLCRSAIAYTEEKKIIIYEKYASEDLRVEFIGGWQDFNEAAEEYSDDDKRKLDFFNTMEIVVPCVISVICLFLCSLLYYRVMMKKPFRIISETLARIMVQDFSVPVRYGKNNEFSLTCNMLEMMRKQLKNNITEMQETVERRKDLTAHYTQEITTSLADLQKCEDAMRDRLKSELTSPEEFLPTARQMQQSIEHLGGLVSSMNQIQKAEKFLIKKESVKTENFLAFLKESAKALCESSGLDVKFQSTIPVSEFIMDLSVAQLVYENLLGNALRYAEKCICISCTYEELSVKIIIRDDGKGFSKEGLKHAGQCYYRECPKEDDLHFGVGLYISGMLCEKHGGRLEIENWPAGGAAVSAVFGVEEAEC